MAVLLTPVKVFLIFALIYFSPLPHPPTSPYPVYPFQRPFAKFTLSFPPPPNQIIPYTFFKKPWDKQLEYIDYFKPIIRFYSILKPLMGVIGSI